MLAIGWGTMLVALNRVRCVESNPPAIRAGRLLNVIERALAVGVIELDDVVGETILALYDEIPLSNLKA